jgi:hypothetical protein
MVFTVFSLPRYKAFYNNPITSLDRLGRAILRMSAFFAGAVGTSWGAICLFQQLLPRHTLPTQRFFLGGFLGGLWAFLEKDSGRGNFLYCARLSVESAWRVGAKRGVWKGVKGGDVWLLVAAMAVMNVALTRDKEVVRSRIWARIFATLRGENAALLQRRENEEVKKEKAV